MEPSNYCLYLYEREGKEIVESEKGFATYFYLNDGCYIQDIYVKSEFRKEGVASQMADQIASIAKSKGYKTLYGTICPNANGSTESLKVLLAYGFSLDSCTTNLIAMKKGL